MGDFDRWNCQMSESLGSVHGGDPGDTHWLVCWLSDKYGGMNNLVANNFILYIYKLIFQELVNICCLQFQSKNRKKTMPMPPLLGVGVLYRKGLAVCYRNLHVLLTLEGEIHQRSPAECRCWPELYDRLAWNYQTVANMSTGSIPANTPCWWVSQTRRWIYNGCCGNSRWQKSHFLTFVCQMDCGSCSFWPVRDLF